MNTYLETKLTEIKTKIVALEEAIKNSPYTIEDAEVASSLSSNFYNNPEDYDFADHDEFFDSVAPMQLLCDIATLQGFQKTLTERLMYCPAKYVVTNHKGGLISPAGFGRGDRVYVQEGLAIHVDDLKDVPSCNQPLYAHEVQSLPC